NEVDGPPGYAQHEVLRHRLVAQAKAGDVLVDVGVARQERPVLDVEVHEGVSQVQQHRANFRHQDALSLVESTQSPTRRSAVSRSSCASVPSITSSKRFSLSGAIPGPGH